MQVMMRMVLLYWPHPKGETGERRPVPGVVTGWRRTVAGRENLHGNSERNGRGTRGRREDEARARRKLANASSRSRSNKASRTAFPAPIRSMSPSRPRAWRTKGKHSNHDASHDEAMLTNWHRGSRSAVPFIMMAQELLDIFEISAIELPYHPVETLPFIGFGGTWLVNILALTAFVAVPTARSRRSWRSRSGRRPV